MAFHHSPNIVTDGLELFLDPGDKNSYPGSGTAWYDLSGNQQHQTITFDTGGEFKTANGGYIYFGAGTTGSGASYVDANYSPFNVATSTATLSFWRRRTATSNNASDFFSMDRDDANGVRISQGTSGNDAVTFGTDSQSDQLSSSALTDNVWYHVVCTLASTLKNIYINGILNASDTEDATTISRSGSGEDSIGNLHGLGNGYQFKGDFGPVIFYRKALSSKEVRQNFNAQRHRFGV